MKKIYDKQSSLTFPNGKTYTAEELAQSSFYKILTVADCIIDVNEAGITSSFSLLADMKEAFGVTIEDPNSALEECLRLQNEQEEQAKQDVVTIAEVSAKTDENTQALGELGTMVADGQTANADLLQAVGELGVQVAELSAKIEQLQTPTA